MNVSVLALLPRLAILLASPFATALLSPAEAACTLVQDEASNSFFSDLTLEQGLEKSEAEGRLLFCYFYSTWDNTTKQLDAGIWKDRLVKAWMDKHAVAIRLDYDESRPLLRKHQVGKPGISMFIRADGSEIDRYEHRKKPNAQAFLNFVFGIGAGESPLQIAHEKMKAEPENPMHIVEHGVWASIRGRYRESLRSYLRAFDEGADDEWFQLYRRDVLLVHIRELSNELPSAKTDLLVRADNLREEVRAGREGQLDGFGKPLPIEEADRKIEHMSGDIAAILRTLLGLEEAYGFFDEFQDEDFAPAVHRGAYFYVQSVLARDKRYADMLTSCPDPAGLIDDLFEEYERNLAGRLAYDKRSPRWQITTSMASTLRRDVMPIYEVLLFAERYEEAKALSDRVLSQDSTGDAYVELVRRTSRVGRMDMAIAFRDQGLAILKDRDRRRLVRSAKSMIK